MVSFLRIKSLIATKNKAFYVYQFGFTAEKFTKPKSILYGLCLDLINSKVLQLTSFWGKEGKTKITSVCLTFELITYQRKKSQFGMKYVSVCSTEFLRLPVNYLLRFNKAPWSLSATSM